MFRAEGPEAVLGSCPRCFAGRRQLCSAPAVAGALKSASACSARMSTVSALPKMWEELQHAKLTLYAKQELLPQQGQASIHYINLYHFCGAVRTFNKSLQRTNALLPSPVAPDKTMSNPQTAV